MAESATNDRGSMASDSEAEATSTMNTGGIENSTFQHTIEKLNGKNYREWAQSMKLIIDGKGKLGYLTGETKKPASTNATLLQKWKSENSMVTAWLVNSMKATIGKTYLFLPTAKDVWEAVKEMYSDSENFSRIFEIKSKLWQTKQGDRDVIDYYLEMTGLWQELDQNSEEEWKCAEDSVRYVKKLETERVFEFLAGLRRDLDDVRGRILGRRPLPSPREVFAEVRREEDRRKIMLNGLGAPAMEASGLASNRIGPPTYGLHSKEMGVPYNGPVNGGIGPTKSNNGVGLYNGPTNLSDGYLMTGQYSKGAPTGPGPKQRGRPWCEHCRKPGHKEDTCWDLHGKPSDWKPRQNNKNRGYQASVDYQTGNSESSSAFNTEQMEQLHRMFSSLQSSSQTSTKTPSSSLAHKGNFLKALQSITQSKTPWIIDSGASDHMTDSYHLFTTYSTCAGNLKVKIADGSLSPVAGKGSIRISDSIILESVLHVPKLSCNLLSISQLTKNSNCSAKFFPSYCLFQDLSSGKTIGSAEEREGLYYFDEADEKLPPTDSRLRPDQRCLENGEYEMANAEKLRLEQQQRQARKMQERGWKPQWFAKDKGSDTYRYIGGYWEAREQGKWESCPDIFGQISSDQILE